MLERGRSWFMLVCFDELKKALHLAVRPCQMIVCLNRSFSAGN